MRTLQSLRDSCIDKDTVIKFIEVEGPSVHDQPPTSGITCFTYANSLEAGFYYITGELSIFYDKTNFTFPFSRVSTAFRLAYHNISQGTNYTEFIDVKNAYNNADDSYEISVNIQKPIYIEGNTGNFSLYIYPSNFAGTEEPVTTSGGSSNGFSQSFNLVEWDDAFNWSDVEVQNTYPGSGDIEGYLQETHLTDFTIDAGKEGSHFGASVQFQAWLPNGFVNDGLPAGVFKSATIETCHLIIRDGNGVEISRNSSSGSYRTFLDISVILDIPGTYKLYASGAGHTSLSTVEQHGYTPLLVSRTKTGTKNSLNTDTAMATAALRIPVFTEIKIDGTTTESSTYLSQAVAPGVANLPNYTFKGGHLIMRRIF